LGGKKGVEKGKGPETILPALKGGKGGKSTITRREEGKGPGGNFSGRKRGGGGEENTGSVGFCGGKNGVITPHIPRGGEEREIGELPKRFICPVSEKGKEFPPCGEGEERSNQVVSFCPEKEKR